jgi:hypothetical protein
MTRYFLMRRDQGQIACQTYWSHGRRGDGQGAGLHIQGFATLADARRYTGGTRYSLEEGLVDVYLDGVHIDAQGQPLDTKMNGADLGDDSTSGAKDTPRE